VIAADALEVNSLLLAHLSDPTKMALREALPPAASANNPVDMLASASPDQYSLCLSILLQDEGVDGVMLILPPPPMFKAEAVAEALVPVIRDAAKPVLLALMGSVLVEEAAEVFRGANIPAYPFPERAASALAALTRRAEFLRKVDSAQATGDVPTQRHTVTDPVKLMASYGIPTAPMKLARDAEEAASISRELGFPVVMKVASEDIPHKSDVGGVLLNVMTEEQARIGYTQTLQHVFSLKPGARIDGVHLQRQIPQGQEVIAGMVRDPLFGPLIMFGSGGVEVEGLKDVAFALAPLTDEDARELLRKTWAGRKLSGFRNILPADEAAVVDVLLRLSRLAVEHEEIDEIEINPLRVLQSEAVAVDVRMKCRYPAEEIR
jgi:acetyltransferase